MVSQIALEVEKLYEVVTDMLGKDSPFDFDHELPLYSAALTEGQVKTVQHGLERRLIDISSSAVPVVTVIPAVDGEQPPALKVRFFERYLKDKSGKDWYVDIPSPACWHFMTDDERSAVELCHHWNTPLHRDYLESVRFEVLAERDTLRLCLLHLRDSGIRVKKFGYKSDGNFEDLLS